MQAILSIKTDDRSGTVTLAVDGEIISKSEFISAYADATDFCATRHAVDLVKNLHLAAAQRSVGNRPLDSLDTLHTAVAREFGVRLSKESDLGRAMAIAKRTLDDSTRQ